MLNRAIPILSLIALSGLLGVSSEASADRQPEKPTAPKNIDQTPPLVPIPNARVSKTGLLVGGQPSPDQLKRIEEAGYRTVITLRAESEPGDEGEQAAVERLGMKFVSIPVPGPAGLTEANARLSGKSAWAARRVARGRALQIGAAGERLARLEGLRGRPRQRRGGDRPRQEPWPHQARGGPPRANRGDL